MAVSEIFVSYASADRVRVAALVHALEAEGLQLWWDRDIGVGQSYSTIIEQALAAAPCVIVVWTRESIQSAWVTNEASDARKRTRLVPVLFDPVAPPLEFRHLQTADLSNWQGDPTDPAFTGLRKAVVTMLGTGDILRPVVPASLTASLWQTWPGRMLGTGALLVGVAMVLLTLRFVGVLGPTADGSVVPVAHTSPITGTSSERTPAREGPASSERAAHAPVPPADAPLAPEPVNLLSVDAGARLVTTNPGVEDRWKAIFTPFRATANLYANDYAVIALPGETPAAFDTMAVFVDQALGSYGVKELEVFISSASSTGPFVKAARITVPNYQGPREAFHEFRFTLVRARFVRLQLLSFHILGTTGYVGSLRLYDSTKGPR